MRTRVFLVLLAIAIGASGAAIYLALEADDGGNGGGASTEEVQSLREQVELEGGGGADDRGARSRRSPNCAARSKPCRRARKAGAAARAAAPTKPGRRRDRRDPEKEAKKIPESEAE